MSCGKEKDNSHVPSGRVAHMTVTQHTPDTAYRLEYTFAWQDTLLECVKCLLPDGRTERMECRYSGTRLTETAVYAADGAMRERWIYTYSGDRLARQTLTMEGCSAECTFRRTAFRYGDTPNPLRLPLGMELSTCWSLTRTGVMGDYYHMLPLHFSAGCPVAAVCDEGASYTAEYTCDGDGRPTTATLQHGAIRTEIEIRYLLR